MNLYISSNEYVDNFTHIVDITHKNLKHERTRRRILNRKIRKSCEQKKNLNRKTTENKNKNNRRTTNRNRTRFSNVNLPKHPKKERFE